METRLTTASTTTSTPARVPSPAPVPDADRTSVLSGMREGVIVCDRQGVVLEANPAARELLGELVVGEVVDVAGCASLTRLVHAGPDGADVELALGPGGGRRVRVGSRELSEGGSCWYLLDVTESYRRADSLLAAEERARFLAEAGRVLHGVLHLDRTLRAVAEIAVPRLAPIVLAFVHTGGETVHWARAEVGSPRAATGQVTVAELRSTPRLHEVLTAGVPADPWDALELAELDVWAPGSAPASRPLWAIGMASTGIARGVLVLAPEGSATTPDVTPDMTPDATPSAPRPLETGGRTDRTDADDSAEAQLVAAYASRAGAALASAALFREQSHLGTVLQESLAPPALPEDTGVLLGAAYRPARETLRVGGDFYEVLRAEPDGVSFLLGDVCGKGIEAAVLSGRVRQSLQAMRLLERDPRRLLELLNTALFDAAAVREEAPRFATLVLGEARRCPERDDGSVVLELATGGHPPPLVLRADGGVETIELEGMLVGAIRGAGFGRVEVVLAPGELCLLYSDGVTEARGPAGFFGEGRLEAALASCRDAPPAVTCERLVALLGDWLGDRDHDDVALLALQAPRTS